MPQDHKLKIVDNTIYNFLGQVIPLLVGIFTIPPVVKGLGVDQFGLLTIAWMFLGYFSMFDLGIGRATINYVSRALNKNNMDEIRRVIWSSLFIQVCLGLVGTVVLVLITPLLVRHVIKMPESMLQESGIILYIIAGSYPIVILSTGLRGVLEALHRFDVVNLVKGPASILNYLIPYLGYLAGFNLTVIIIASVVSRIVFLFVYIVCVVHQIPEMKKGFALSGTMIKSLFSYGGWISITSVFSPVYYYLERFLITYYLSIGLLTYYTVPFEILMKVLIIPSSIAMTLFPTFSFHSHSETRVLLSMFFRPMKYLAILLSPILITGLLFADTILTVWMGEAFAEQSTVVFQVIVLIVVFNSLAIIPFTAVQGLGRPDLKTKLDFVLMPLYIGLCAVCIPRWGIVGAAICKLVLTVVDYICLLYLSKLLLHFSFVKTLFSRDVIILASLCATLTIIAVYTNDMPLYIRFAAALVFSLFMVFYTKARLIDTQEIAYIKHMLSARFFSEKNT